MERSDRDHRSIDDVSRIHTTRGSILLGPSRDTAETAKDKLATLLSTPKALKVQDLITTGGAGTAYMASLIEHETRGRIAIVHVPTTIDNTSPCPGDVFLLIPFSTPLGAAIVGNLIEDVKTTGRRYIMTTVGQAAVHFALDI